VKFKQGEVVVDKEGEVILSPEVEREIDRALFLNLLKEMNKAIDALMPRDNRT